MTGVTAGMSYVEMAWVGVGFLGQAAFTSRFLVQWVASERKRDSVMPVSFWWLSLIGGAVMLTYALHKRDPVFIVGQATGLVVYARNLMLVSSGGRGKSGKDPGVSEESETTRGPHMAGRETRVDRPGPR